MKTIVPLFTILLMGQQPSVAETTQPLETLHLQNEQVRIGLDLGSGGSLNYLSEADSDRNVLNHFDRGRFIQQSIYGDPDGSIWVNKPWRWNPVQGGDYQGSPATILEKKQTLDFVYIKTMPKHWATGEDIESVVMEQWIRLQGPIVHIRYRITYTGEKNHSPHHQEMPAVFVDAAFPTLVYYSGEAPWSGAALTRKIPGWPNQYVKRSEEWSAFVNKDNWGVGVYTPGTPDITCYRYEGSTGPTGSGCSYFSPVRTLAITKDFTLQYDVYLSLGDPETLRKRFQAIQEKEPES